jgi:hypothetical protein
MAFFGVTLEIIDKLEPIPGADRIVKATLRGIDFSFVVGKGQFEEGGTCVYLPIDSILPLSLQEKLNLAGKLGGKNKDRIRTVRLKGVYSEGIAVSPDVVALELLTKNRKPTSEELTAYLGVTKYDPEEKADKEKAAAQAKDHKCWPWYKRWAHRLFSKKIFQYFYPPKGGSLMPLNELGISVYDIEGCNRHKEVVEDLMDKPVIVTLKVEGQNAAVLWRKGKVFVNQRRYSVIKSNENPLWEIANKQRIIAFAEFMAHKFKEDEVLVYYEACGSNDGAGAISGNIYKFKDFRGYIFDIKVGGKFIPWDMVRSLYQEFYGNLEFLVPTLCFGQTLGEWLGGRTVEQAAEVKGVLRHCDSEREEGIVIHPALEYEARGLGRVILKFRSLSYKAEHGDKE